MDHDTVAVYEAESDRWADARRATPRADAAAAFAARVVPGATRVDLGCGPGRYLDALGRGGPVVALDATAAMLTLAGEHVPGALRVRADLEALPFADETLGGAWAVASYVHVARPALPLALGRLQRALALDAPVELVLARGDQDLDPFPRDDFPGRRFAAWQEQPLVDVVEGAGFETDAVEADDDWITVRAHRARRLRDTVGPGMRVLVAGLNPSLHTADAGVGYVSPGNRFWPAAVASGLVTRDRDPLGALRDHRVGMTNLVLRATPRADAISAAEYREGAARVERLVRWLEPEVVLIVGITGWRAATGDKKAALGLQPAPFGGKPVYVMPNTSGLNAHAKPADYVDHLRAVIDLAG